MSNTKVPTVTYNPFAVSEPFTHMAEVDELRSRHAAFWSDYANGFWVLAETDAVRRVLQDPKTFSNCAVNPIDPFPEYMLIPEMLDPPSHTAWRQRLAPWFSPKAIEALAPRVRNRCIELIEPLVDQGHCEFNRDFSYRYPTSIFLELMGLPTEDLVQFQHWIDEINHLPLDEEWAKKRSFEAQEEVKSYFVEMTTKRRAAPENDLISVSLTWKIRDADVPMEDLLSMYLLMFQAGMDTVANQLTYMWWHLAAEETDRRASLVDASASAVAVEEFLRYYAIVSTTRKVKQDVVVEGCPMRAGDMVYMPLCGATRDPRSFSDGTTFVVNRDPNPHLAFGAGPHRCLGSHLARNELRIAMEEWHSRIPNYFVVEGQTISEHGGVFGLDSLELAW